MKTLLILFLIFSLLVLLALFLKQPLRIMLILSGDTKSAIYSFRHKLFSMERGKVLLLDDGSISVVNKKSILLQRSIPKGIMLRFVKFIFNKIDLSKLKLYISSKPNSMQSAMFLGASSGIGEIINQIMPQILKGEILVETVSSSEQISVAVESQIKVSLFWVIWSYVKAKKQYNKSKEKNYAKAN